MTLGSNKLYFGYDASGTPLQVVYNGTTYYYVTNLQGDVIAILNSSGTAVVQYTYDAWGNPISTTGSMATTLGTHNPLRYRGYVYDQETNLYYLQSRYYNPKTGRFLNADAFAATGQGLLSNNVFVYCCNNPTNFQDSTGTYMIPSDPLRGGPAGIQGVDAVSANTCTPGNNGKIKNAVADFYNNTDASAAINAQFFAYYKGKLVIITPFDASFSFGIIGLSDRNRSVDVLNHEYGHTVQFDSMGFVNYTREVAIPSIMINVLDRKKKLPYNYYSYPFEAEANQLGNSKLSQSWKDPLPDGEYSSYFDLIPLFY